MYILWVRHFQIEALLQETNQLYIVCLWNELMWFNYLHRVCISAWLAHSALVLVLGQVTLTGQHMHHYTDACCSPKSVSNVTGIKSPFGLFAWCVKYRHSTNHARADCANSAWGLSSWYIRTMLVIQTQFFLSHWLYKLLTKYFALIEASQLI